MSDWLPRFADALGEEPLLRKEVSAILDLTRDVAHGTERKLAPLTSYLLGIQLGRRLEAGADREEAFAEAVDRILAELPDAPETADAPTETADAPSDAPDEPA